MKYRACINDRNYQVIVEDIYPDPEGEVTVEVGYDRYRTRILSWDRETGVTSILIGGVPYDVEMIRDARGQLEAIKIDCEIYTVNEIQTGKILTTRRTSEVVKEGVVRAFMPGLIVKVLKKAGDAVEEGETVCFMEAMKMQNALVAPRSGRLARLEVAEGETVLTSDLLFTVE